MLAGRGWKLLLAIDTSAGTSTALFDGQTLLSAIEYDDPFGHAENIGNAIAEVLHRANQTAKAVTAVAIGRGPAPYTGLRVGMAAGTSFATALGLPMYSVMNLDAVALSLGEAKIVVSSDAKRRELFVAAYELGERVFGPAVLKPEELEQFADFESVDGKCNAELIGRYAIWALERGIDLSDSSALYLRSPDVAPSAGKRVSS
ncbi:MAG: tRNA ((37)-N6)-threonylcarbamoyltransferase complex dimerization subunit type 1 TsaB [Actinomycetota bacterium]